jgi:outer membrane receptor protein involved in Fe transport
MAKRLLVKAVLLSLVLVGILCRPASAQLSNGTIRGTVTDASGAVLSQAKVELTNEKTSEHYATTTSKDGYYTFVALGPGEYAVKVTAEGFNEWSGKLILRVAQVAVIDASLKPGSVMATVTVTDMTPVINAGDSTLSDVKEETRISTIPVAKSSLLNALAFSPGVVANSYGGLGSGYTRVNGIPGGSVTFQMDGENSNDRFTNELQATPQAIQTIQEMKVTTSNGSAEYGTPGVIDVVTKGGTNQFHGQVHELYETGGLGATGYNALTSHLVHHDFGGQIGGPVWIPHLYKGRDKTFFFFDAQKQIEHKLGADGELLPQQNWLKGDFSDYVDVNGKPIKIYDPLSGVYDASTGTVTRTQFPNNKIPDGRMNSIAAKIAAYIPKPNVACPNQDCYQSGSPNWLDPSGTALDNILRYTGKGDQIIGKNTLSARYTYTKEHQRGPAFGGYSGYILNPQVRDWGGHNATLSYTSPIHNNAVNEARLGIQLFNAGSGPVAVPGLYSALGLTEYPGSYAWPGVYWWDSNQYNMAVIDRPNPKNQPNQNISLADNYSWTKGRHEMKFGVSVANFRVMTQEDQNPGGNYNFSGGFTSLQDPSSGRIDSANATATVDTGAGLGDMLLGELDYLYYNQVPNFHTRQTDYYAYAQDNWRVNPKLTLNLGVRYEYWSPYMDSGGLEATLDLKGKPADCSIPAALTGSTAKSCVTAGTAGYPAWFQQTSPYVVIPDSGSDQSAATLAAYKAIGMPIKTASQAGISSTLWNMSKKNWAPRLGFAYLIDPKTVVRGGFGIYFWTMPLVQFQQNTRDNQPWWISTTNQTDNNLDTQAELAFPFGPSTLSNQCNCTSLQSSYSDPRQLGKVSVDVNTGAAINAGFSIAPWDPNYKAQKAQEWNLTVERALPSNWAVAISYVGNRADHLVNYDPINANLPRELISATDFGSAARRAYPIYGNSGTGSMDLFTFSGYSNHNEGRAEIKHTMGSFTLQGYFTFARTLTTSEGSSGSYGGLQLVPAALTENAPLSQRLRMIYAPDSYLPAKTFVINGHYELPLGKNKMFLANSGTLVNGVVSGWNVSMFYMWHSGLYFSPRYNANPGIASSSNQYILAPGSTSRGILPKNKRTRTKWFDGSIWDPSGGSAYAGQTFMIRTNSLDWDLYNGIPRNYMTGPGFSNADGTLYKQTPLGGHATLGIEMQVFNVFNHTNLSLPGNTGVISKGLGQPRMLQFQGKITF